AEAPQQEAAEAETQPAPQQEARPRAKSAGEQRIRNVQDIAAEQREGRTPEEQQRFERGESRAAKRKIKGATFETSP
ncbi:hypothetical protein, partial [Burkholderia sp. SIMBA_024]|uniref:hypothetical protein n=1 Tax=Burkholderia sp. SIMBA_024 TaxID=3085768 RepID=UPI00397E37E3